jgi:hypothetical protein
LLDFFTKPWPKLSFTLIVVSQTNLLSGPPHKAHDEFLMHFFLAAKMVSLKSDCDVVKKNLSFIATSKQRQVRLK